MLEQTRRQASIFVYLIFGLLIVIFIYGINPGNRGGRDSGGCGTTSNTVVAVDGSDASQSAFRVAYSMYQGQTRQRTYNALDQLIFREMLADAAAARGIRATGDLLDDEIMKGHHGYFYLGGERLDVTGQFFEDVDGEKLFSRRRWLDWISARNLQSPNSYRDEQARGLQAAMMADLITGSVRVSRDEALSNYLYENNTVTYDVVAFEPGKYRRAMKLTDADSRRYLDAHADEVQARYKTDERTYKGVKPQLSLREIFIPKAAPAARPDDKPASADDKAKADDKAAKPAKPGDKTAKPGDKTAKTDDKTAKPGDKTAKTDDKAAKPGDKTAKTDDKKPAAGAAKPIGLPVDVARAKLEAIRAEITAGKLTFPDAEKQLAAEAADVAAAENGDRGWQSADGASLGEKPVNDAVKALKSGEMTPVIVTERGTYLVIATARREGDLTFDQVKTEIAALLAKDAWSKEAAKRAALEALAKVDAAKPLDQLFERAPVKPPGGGIEELLQDPNLSQEQKQRILEQLIQQQQKHGSLELHEQDVPVAWYADADGSAKAAPAAAGTPAPVTGTLAPAAGTPAPAAAGTPAPSAAGSAAPAAGSAAPAAGGPATAGSAAAGSAAPAAAPAVPAAPAPDIVASSDVLPALADVPKPKIDHFGPTPRQPKMPGVGGSKPAIDALFDELAPGSVAKKIYEGDAGSYVIVQLISRAQPNVADFDKTAETEIARMRDARGKAALHDWFRFRCDALKKSGRIRPAAELTRETDDKGNPAPTVYHPCMSLDFLDR